MKNGIETGYYNCVIQPGYLAYSREPAFIYTVCGNGLVVTLRDKMRGVGGIAHCVWPRAGAGEIPTNFHADVALESLLRALGKQNRSGFFLEAQLIGGGHYRGLHRSRAQKTIRTVRRILRSRGIEIVSEDIGGELGRRIVFNTATGETVVLKTARVRRTDWLPETIIDGKIIRKVKGGNKAG